MYQNLVGTETEYVDPLIQTEIRGSKTSYKTKSPVRNPRELLPLFRGREDPVVQGVRGKKTGVSYLDDGRSVLNYERRVIYLT